MHGLLSLLELSILIAGAAADAFFVFVQMDQSEALGAQLIGRGQDFLGTYAGAEEAALAPAHIQYYLCHSYLTFHA